MEDASATPSQPKPKSIVYQQVLVAPRTSFVPETVEQIRAAKAEIVRTNIESSERLACSGEEAGTFALRYVLMTLSNRRKEHARQRQRQRQCPLPAQPAVVSSSM